jgi:hypothetical protein
MHLKYINKQDVSEVKDMLFKWINYADCKLSHFYPEMRSKNERNEICVKMSLFVKN